MDPCPIAPDPQRDLLGHGATRHQHRCLLAEQIGDTTLQTLDHVAVAVVILVEIGADGLGEIDEYFVDRLPGVVAEPA
jgi:hypothetical protein